MSDCYGSFMMLVDDAGRRNLVRIGSIQLLADCDELHDATIMVVAGRAITVPRPLDDIVAEIELHRSFPRSRR